MSSQKFVLMQTQYYNGLTIHSCYLSNKIFSRVAEYIVLKTPRNITKTIF